ncbi:type-F conjugative transfer system mating-pair stabilization protein TraN [Vibrio parahaemolyticus]|uniref:type-F conjugative transfer system mating-pair stabilization protein TraN n=1 Tax=Vibrio parahaemolyticus TaxID=670 RepID=UPI00221E827A|nr:type-F conjugative transfer system mating-pair stabilization protein TraN [Vibrio parahaemolyticus]MCZ6417386.1 type-F conjugative transfer system mating-pair stabilization protein TraN [Vibrio parahaemolyticus]MCZ6422353.1 type-F conjugative transfer system mating-pair stabilization protein TraN [Vibrio parahaemolyticus]MEA5339184.1 type-F conjugative transfer system mating-pair stabilization protein TraN [Vibrio parahaemolyticus]WPD17875.1 type-F conjugative transfer system mating-pair sta
MSKHTFISDCLLFILTSSLLISTQALSDPQETTFYDNVEWTKNAPAQAYNDPNMTINLSDFCAEDNPGCESQIRNPAEAGMSDIQITDKSTTEFYSNDHAGAIQDNFNKGRPNVTNDPAYDFALIGQDNAYEITHGISNTYVNCDTNQQCIIDHIDRQCSAPTNELVPCDKTPVATPMVREPEHVCESGWELKGDTCHGWEEECRFDSQNRVTMESKTGYFSCSATAYIPTYLWKGQTLNDTTGYRAGQFQFNSNYNSCGIALRKVYGICGLVPVTKPAELGCFVGWTLSGGQCVKNIFSWKTECELMPECSAVSETCIEGPETRIVNGIPTYRSCWKYQIDHQCQTDNTCNALPADCEVLNTQCRLQQYGVCIENDVTMRCPFQKCSSTSLFCGEESFCLDGDCFEEIPTTDDAFDESLAALAALADAADGIGDPPMIFTGNSMQCTDKAFGFADCCKDGGWGTGLGLDECNEQEKALGRAKEQGVTIALGSYCASSFLGACTRKKKSYCVFDSKLARIIQEQGVKGQLGIGLGTAKNPICGAITPEQLQEINFELIDFTDFYGDMHDNANVPSEEEIKDRLQSAYGN